VPVTLITGAASGIGAATARALLAAGHQVAVTGRDETRLAELAQSVGAPERLLTVKADAGLDADVQEAVARTVERFGALTNIVANAGFSSHDTLASGDPEQWREMVLINVLGPALLIRAALPALTKAAGEGNETQPRIVLVGSVAGLKNTPGNMYSVTKWAITGMAENTRLLVTGQGIGVTLIAPGRVDTPFWDGRPGSGPLEGPVLSADDIARAIAWTFDQPAGVDVNTVVVRPVGQAV
jgi:NADP-dependent 3-hydroxy acid dehydrogenase YdfG